MIRQRAASLGHLHEAQHSLIHPRAAAGGDDNHGQALVRAGLNEPRKFFTDDRTHRAAEEAEVHHAKCDALVADFADAGDDKRGCMILG